MKTYNIGNYTFVINDKPDYSLKHPYSAYLYKGPKCITGFRSKDKITEDKLIEFIFDSKCIRKEPSIVE